jgi:hypothetical protein
MATSLINGGQDDSFFGWLSNGPSREDLGLTPLDNTNISDLILTSLIVISSRV